MSEFSDANDKLLSAMQMLTDDPGNIAEFLATQLEFYDTVYRACAMAVGVINVAVKRNLVGDTVKPQDLEKFEKARDKAEFLRDRMMEISEQFTQQYAQHLAEKSAELAAKGEKDLNIN